MQTQIRWNTKELTKDLPEDESGFYKAIGELLPEIEIPNKLYISCHMGDAEFLLKQRGTYTKNGEVKPSLYVTEEYNNIYGLTPSTYSDAYLTCINPESNNYKYYWLRPSADAIHATYGRIGSERGEMFGTKELKNPYEPHLFWIRYYEKLSKDNQMQVEPAQIQIHVSEVERNDIKIYRIDDSRSTNREKLTTVCEKLTRSYMSLSSSLSEQERLLAEQNGQKDFTEIEEREQERVINFKALIRSFSTL